MRDIGAPKPFGDPTPIQRNYEWSEYLGESRQHRLLGSVHVQCDGGIAEPLAETAWVQSVFDQSALAHAIVGLVDLSSHTAGESIEAQARYRDFRGVRQILSRLDEDESLSFASTHLVRDPAWQEGYALLAGHGLSFDLQLYPEQMHEVAEFVGKHADIPVIIDHAGSPHDASVAGRQAWMSGMACLSELPHVAVKLSGFGMFDSAWSRDSVRPLVEHLLSCFGSERVLWGSNFPVDSLMASFDHGVSSIDACLQGLSDDERRLVLVENARRLYRLDVEGEQGAGATIRAGA